MKTKCQWLRSPLPENLTSELEARLQSQVEKREEEKKYTKAEREHIRDRKIFTQAQLSIPVEHLDTIRKMCQVWDIQLLPRTVQSHRAFVGPVIVWIKSKVFPLVEIVLKDSLRQQREFNAASIEAITKLSSRP